MPLLIHDPDDLDAIVKAQHAELQRLQAINPKIPIRIKILEGKTPKGEDPDLYRWLPYPNIWNKVDRPIYTRGILANEILIDPDTLDWQAMKTGVEKLCNYCKENNIPVQIGFSGGKGVHCSIVIGNIPLDTDFVNKIKEADIDAYKTVRRALFFAIMGNAGVKPADIGVDLAKINFDTESKGSQIRTFGTIRAPGLYKTLIEKIPDHKPEPYELPLIFPERVETWEIEQGSEFYRIVVDALEKEAARAKKANEYPLTGIDFSGSEIMDFPCIKTLYGAGLEHGRYYAGEAVLLMCKKCGISKEEAEKHMRELYRTFPTIFPADTDVYISNALSMYESKNFSCRALKELFPELKLCNFSACPIKERVKDQNVKTLTNKLKDIEVPDSKIDCIAAAKKFASDNLLNLPVIDGETFLCTECKDHFELAVREINLVIKDYKHQKAIQKKEEVARNTENEDIRRISKKILEVSQKDIQETLGVPTCSNLDMCEVEKYHIETCRALHLKGFDIFGNPEYNTANFRTGNSGLFYYDPKRVYITEYEEGVEKKVFDHWSFTEEELSPTPITIVDSARNIDSDYGEILYTLKVKNEYGEVNVFTEHKNSLFTKKGIIDLINKNFCVTDTSSLTLWKIQEYFKTLLYGNADIIPRTLAAESTGWKEEGRYFVIGNRAYSKDGVLDIHMLDSYTEQVYKPKGDPKKYFSGISEVLETFPIAQFMMYASCASPLLSILGLDSVVVFLRGQSTTGKTKMCKLAVSPFTYLTKVAESTKSYQELDTAQNDGLPTFYDEASGNEGRLNNIIYMLAGGTGKGRATEFGKGVNHGKTWKTVVIYNGENPILNQADNVGKFVRVIEIKNPVEKSPENKVLMDRIEETCSENHGWLADPFLKEVFRRKKEIPAMYERNLQKFGKSNDAGERLKRYFAAFATAGELLEGIFAENGIKTLPAFDIVDMFFKEVVLGRPIEDEYRRALKIVMNWVVSNEGTKVINTTSPEKSEVKPAEVWAWITEPQTKELKISSSERICFVPAKLRQLLEEHGFNQDKIVEAWAEKGIVDSKRKKKDGIPYGQYVTELQKNVNGRTITAVKIIYDNALEELDLVEHPVLKMPEKTPLQEMKEIVKTLAEDRFKRGIRDTKEALVNHTLELFPKTYARKDIEFVVEGLCKTGEILAMPSA